MEGRQTDKFPVVGVGASAGGIKSFKSFLGAIPDNSGMAFIILQHLSPEHDSLLPEILTKTTKIPVVEITSGSRINPDHIYVLPQNTVLKISGYNMVLYPREKEIQNMPIDIFFSSLAREHQHDAIGVVLSGTDHDGTVGLREIKDLGGLTFVEDPTTATFGGMPESAIKAGVVDFVMTAEEIPSKILNIHASYRIVDETGDARKENILDDESLDKILSLMMHAKGVDFKFYKRPTIYRRIYRRMAVLQIGEPSAYVEFLRANKTEQEELYQDLLIKVTAFFRDPEIFEMIKTNVMPQLLEKNSRDRPVRIWVTACSTGEEAYSLAICMFEAMGARPEEFPSYVSRIQIFGTDISESAINKARKGLYSTAELEVFSEKQLARYFTKAEGGYKVDKAIRDAIVFSVHNFIQDPPFGKVDLVSCRNVLIYMDSFLQQKALSRLHYALNEHGFLILGKSETTGTTSNLFVPFLKKEKIFRRKPGSGRVFQISNRQELYTTNTVNPISGTQISKTDFKKSANSVILSQFAPAGVVVDQHMEIVHINGSIAPFLDPAAGKPTHELMKMVRKELAFELRNAVFRAKASREIVIKDGISLSYHGEQISMAFEVIPLSDLVEPYYLILFRKTRANPSYWSKINEKLNLLFTGAKNRRAQMRNTALENELEQVREDMRRISEDQNAMNEELQSANEELRSSNEEMQSINEELVTSREELHATNDELIVLNRELNHTLDYLNTVIANLREPFLVLDQDLRVQKANGAYYKKFDITEKAIEDMPFFGMQNGLWNDSNLKELITNLLPEKQRMVDEEINIELPSGTKRAFVFNAREFPGNGDLGKQILLSMEDITERKKTEGYRRTIKELKKVNEELDRYVHVASHDLQEPLRKIMIFADLLVNDQKFGKSTNFDALNKISSSAERLSTLVSDLLQYSRVSNHNEAFQWTDLEEIANEMKVDLEILLHEKNAKLEIGELPMLDAVPVQMNQLFSNIVGNALKFTRNDVTPVIEITATSIPKNKIGDYARLDRRKDYFELTFKDNGIGFNPKYKDQIFMMFQRLQSSMDIKGSGIGLAIVKKITDQHQGVVFATSNEGEGTSIHVILPVNQEV